ncbi:hypothetical protein PQI66_09455 [Corynebacterium sp. USCH3]|uniref:hypothetical protein n=1 Tax=Corynebacterium sp. USCH3 TaxID=3024840 RepID=UPI0030B16EC0
MTVISVIGPDARAVEQVTAGVRAAAGRRGPQGHRFVAGAGPGEADGVIAVVTSPQAAVGDMEVIRAVRDAMGVAVVYTPEEHADLADEPGVVHCRWGADGHTGQQSLAQLADTVGGMWVDRHRWEADARRADADRLDRVRIAVRLAADRIATDILERPCGGGADRLFRARLSVAVLEQGVEMPHLAPVEHGDDETPPTGETARATLPVPSAATAVTVAAAVGTGVATAAGVLRMTDSLLFGFLAGLAVMTATAAARWWSGRTARREREQADLAASLRRRWAATVTDVVARLVVPPVAGRLPGGAS